MAVKPTINELKSIMQTSVLLAALFVKQIISAPRAMLEMGRTIVLLLNPLSHRRQLKRRTLRTQRRIRLPKITFHRVVLPYLRDNLNRFRRWLVDVVTNKFGGSFNSAIRMMMSPFDSLITVVIEESTVRIAVARGYRITMWTEINLPEGVIKDGVVNDVTAFQDALDEALSPILGEFSIGGRRLAITISGRNQVQRQFNLFIPDDASLSTAALDALRAELDDSSAEMLLDFEAESSAAPDDEQKARIAASMEVPADRVPSGRTYELYGVGLRRSAVERNASDLSMISSRIASIQPKTMALSAAVNELSAVIVDVEEGAYTVILTKNGLPHVVRESTFDPNVRLSLLAVTIEYEVDTVRQFAQSLEEPITVDEQTPFFVTGPGSSKDELLDLLKKELSHDLTRVPQTLRAPEDFEFDKFASNVGLTLVAGKRFWQLATIPLVNQPRFDLRPDRYRPRPLPVKQLAGTAAVAVLALGVYAGITFSNERLAAIDDKEAEIVSLNNYLDEVSDRSSEIRSLKMDLEQLKAQEVDLRADTELLRIRHTGLGRVLDGLFAPVGENVVIGSVNEIDGQMTLEVLGRDHRSVLEFVNSVDSAGHFASVRVDRVIRHDVSGGDVIGFPVEAHVEMVRLPSAIEIDEPVAFLNSAAQ